MVEINIPQNHSVPAITKLWQRIPLLVRTLLSGYIDYAIASTVARAAVLTFVPVPWSLPVMWIGLGLYLKYFSGSWWPKSIAYPAFHGKLRATYTVCLRFTPENIGKNHVSKLPNIKKVAAPDCDLRCKRYPCLRL